MGSLIASVSFVMLRTSRVLAGVGSLTPSLSGAMNCIRSLPTALAMTVISAVIVTGFAGGPVPLFVSARSAAIAALALAGA